MEGECLVADALFRMAAEHKEDSALYLKDPTAHPGYEAHRQKFLRTNEARFKSNHYTFTEIFGKHMDVWKVDMKQILKDAWKKKKSNFLDMMGSAKVISAETLSHSDEMADLRDDCDSARKSMTVHARLGKPNTGRDRIGGRSRSRGRRSRSRSMGRNRERSRERRFVSRERSRSRGRRSRSRGRRSRSRGRRSRSRSKRSRSRGRRSKSKHKNRNGEENRRSGSRRRQSINGESANSAVGERSGRNDSNKVNKSATNERQAKNSNYESGNVEELDMKKDKIFETTITEENERKINSDGNVVESGIKKDQIEKHKFANEMRGDVLKSRKHATVLEEKNIHTMDGRTGETVTSKRKNRDKTMDKTPKEKSRSSKKLRTSIETELKTSDASASYATKTLDSIIEESVKEVLASDQSLLPKRSKDIDPILLTATLKDLLKNSESRESTVQTKQKPHTTLPEVIDIDVKVEKPSKIKSETTAQIEGSEVKNSSREKSKVDEVEINYAGCKPDEVISILSLMNDLRSKLGSLGMAMPHLLEQAKSDYSSGVNPLKSFKSEDKILFEMIHVKFSAISTAEDTPFVEKIVVKEALNQIKNLLSVFKSPDEVVEASIDDWAAATIRMNASETLNFIRSKMEEIKCKSTVSDIYMQIKEKQKLSIISGLGSISVDVKDRGTSHTEVHETSYDASRSVLTDSNSYNSSMSKPIQDNRVSALEDEDKNKFFNSSQISAPSRLTDKEVMVSESEIVYPYLVGRNTSRLETTHGSFPFETIANKVHASSQPLMSSSPANKAFESVEVEDSVLHTTKDYFSSNRGTQPSNLDDVCIVNSRKNSLNSVEHEHANEHSMWSTKIKDIPAEGNTKGMLPTVVNVENEQKEEDWMNYMNLFDKSSERKQDAYGERLAEAPRSSASNPCGKGKDFQLPDAISQLHSQLSQLGANKSCTVKSSKVVYDVSDEEYVPISMKNRTAPKIDPVSGIETSSMPVSDSLYNRYRNRSNDQSSCSQGDSAIKDVSHLGNITYNHLFATNKIKPPVKQTQSVFPAPVIDEDVRTANVMYNHLFPSYAANNSSKANPVQTSSRVNESRIPPPEKAGIAPLDSSKPGTGLARNLIESGLRAVGQDVVQPSKSIRSNIPEKLAFTISRPYNATAPWVQLSSDEELE